MNFENAVSSCNNEQKYLASFTSPADVDIMSSFVPKVYLWLGARYNPKLKSWHWLDGSPWNWTNWRTGQPDDRSNCADIDNEGKWYATSCSMETKPFYYAPCPAEGGERARPGRVLVFFVHFSPCTYKVQNIKGH